MQPVGGMPGAAGAMNQLMRAGQPSHLGMSPPKLRECEIHAQSASSKNFCQRWLSSFPTRSKRIDVISRIFFPLMFGMFNVVYWFTYSFRDELDE